MQGVGKLTYSSGDIFEGIYNANIRNGFGTYKYKMTGDLYEGEWRNDRMTGIGKFTFAQEGRSYQGEFYEGLFHGKGDKDPDK